MASTSQTRLDNHFLPAADRSPSKRRAESSTIPSLIADSSAPADQLSVPRSEHVLRVYVLCGVVCAMLCDASRTETDLRDSGSGKSNLASQWEAVYPDNYTRICQDVLGNRRKCEDAARLSLNKVCRTSNVMVVCKHV